MSLRRAVAVPFRQRGVDTLSQSEFVVAVSLDRDWFSPDQAKRLVETACTNDLLEREDDELTPTFDPGGVDIPDGFVPDERVLRNRSVFETALDRLIDQGTTKQEAVAAINRCQSELGLTIEAAAVCYARRQGLPVADLAARALQEY